MNFVVDDDTYSVEAGKTLVLAGKDQWLVMAEPEVFEHICAVAPNHDCFASGVSDIFHVEDTARRNPTAVVDIIRGAFAEGMRDFTFNLDGNEFIRITGYLVRKSDLAAIESDLADLAMGSGRQLMELLKTLPELSITGQLFDMKSLTEAAHAVGAIAARAAAAVGAVDSGDGKRVQQIRRGRI